MSWISYEIAKLKPVRTLKAILKYTSYREDQLKNPTVRKISEELNKLGYRNSPLTVKTISKISGFGVATVKKHINLLVKAGLLYKVAYSKKTDSYVFVTGVNGKTFLKLILEGNLEENQKLDKVFGENRTVYLSEVVSWNTFLSSLSSFSNPSPQPPSPSSSSSLGKHDVLVDIYRVLSRRENKFVKFGFWESEKKQVSDNRVNKKQEIEMVDEERKEIFNEKTKILAARRIEVREEETEPIHFVPYKKKNYQSEEKVEKVEFESAKEGNKNPSPQLEGEKAMENNKPTQPTKEENKSPLQLNAVNSGGSKTGITDEIKEKIYDWIMKVVEMKNKGLPEAQEEYKKLDRYIRTTLRDGYIPSDWERGQYVIDPNAEIPEHFDLHNRMVVFAYRKKLAEHLFGQEFINRMIARDVLQLHKVLGVDPNEYYRSLREELGLNKKKTEKKEEETKASIEPVKIDQPKEKTKEKKLEEKIKSGELFEDDDVKTITIQDPRFGSLVVRTYLIDEPIVPEVETEDYVSLFDESFFEENIVGIYNPEEIKSKETQANDEVNEKKENQENQVNASKNYEKIDLESANARLEEFRKRMREITSGLMIPYEELPFHERDLGKKIKEYLYKDKDKYKEAIEHIEILGEENYNRIVEVANGSGMFPHIINAWKMRRKELISELVEFKKRGKFPLNLEFINSWQQWRVLPDELKQDRIDIFFFEHPIYDYYYEYYKMDIRSVTQDDLKDLGNPGYLDFIEITEIKGYLEHFQDLYGKYFEIAEEFAEKEQNEVIREFVYKTLMFPAVLWGILFREAYPYAMYRIANKYYLALMDAINLRHATELEVIDYYRQRQRRYDIYEEVAFSTSDVITFDEYVSTLRERYGIELDKLEFIDWWYERMEPDTEEELNPVSIEEVFSYVFVIDRQVEKRMEEMRAQRIKEEWERMFGNKGEGA